MLHFLCGFFFSSHLLWFSKPLGELEPGVPEGCSMHGVLSPHTT